MLQHNFLWQLPLTFYKSQVLTIQIVEIDIGWTENRMDCFMLRWAVKLTENIISESFKLSRLTDITKAFCYD